MPINRGRLDGRTIDHTHRIWLMMAGEESVVRRRDTLNLSSTLVRAARNHTPYYVPPREGVPHLFGHVRRLDGGATTRHLS